MAKKLEEEIVCYTENLMTQFPKTPKTTRLRNLSNTSHENDWNNSFKRQVYKTRVLFVLKAVREYDLIGKMRRREIWDTSAMTAEEVDPDGWRVKLAKQQREADELKRLANAKWTGEKQDGVFTCRKCKSKKTVYREVQTRSADEPMTIFITCEDCGGVAKI